MSNECRRAHPRFKDDLRACRAVLEDQSGRSVELSVIDFSVGGAALTGARDTTQIPQAGNHPLTGGRINFRVPSRSSKHKTRTVEVGAYEVIRQWPRGLGNDAGVAVRFPNPRKNWVKLVEEDNLASMLT